MCCRRSGHDHRPAMITKPYKPVILAHRLGTFLGIQGTPERAGFSPLGRPIRDHLQLITLPSSAHAAAPSYAAESMIEASVQPTARRRSTPNSSRSRNHPPQGRSARNSARRYWLSQSRSATARSPRSSEFDRGIAMASRSAPRFAVAGIRGDGRNSSRSRGSKPSTSDPACGPEVPRRPKVGQRRLHRVRRTADHTGLPSTPVTASDTGDALGMVGRPVSTGLRDSCRLSSSLTRWAAGG